MLKRLIDHLEAGADEAGVVVIAEAVLRKTLRVDSEALRQLLKEAEAAGSIEVLSVALVFKLRKWPGSSGKPEENVGPYSELSKLSLHTQQLKDSYRQDDPQGGTAALNAALMQEILETLGENDPSTFHGAVEHYPPAVIRKALERVRAAKSIRKNRTALFRHLLPRLAKEDSSRN